MTWLVRLVSRTLQLLGRSQVKGESAHLRVGRLGETEAYLYLRNRGYRIVATNFRTPGSRGEIDLVAWDGDVLCFVEVKTRVGVGLVPPEGAVDVAKREHIRAVARRYLRRLPGDRNPPCRFDIVSITYPDEGTPPRIRLIQGAFRWRNKRFFEGSFLSGTKRKRERWTPRS